MAGPERLGLRRGVGTPLGLVLLVTGGVLLLALLVALPHIASSYVVSLAFLVLFFTALTLGWNLFSGYTGYINFGYTAFVGVGAYTMAVLVGLRHWPWPLGLFTSGVTALLLALIVGLPLLRIRGVYFAIAMLGVAGAMGVLTASKYLQPITQGGIGIGFRSGMGLLTEYYIMGLIALLAALLTFAVANSRYGLRLLAIREDELAAKVMGIRVEWYKLSAFLLSAWVAGISGGVLAAFLSYIDAPTVYSINYSLRPIVMALFGGFGTVTGPILGAVAFTLISEIIWARFLALHLLIFGVILILLVLWMPQGIIPWLQAQRLLPRTRKL